MQGILYRKWGGKIYFDSLLACLNYSLGLRGNFFFFLEFGVVIAKVHINPPVVSLQFQCPLLDTSGYITSYCALSVR